MAEGAGLLNRCTVKSRTGGSNPPLSATFISTSKYGLFYLIPIFRRFRVRIIFGIETPITAAFLAFCNRSPSAHTHSAGARYGCAGSVRVIALFL